MIVSFCLKTTRLHYLNAQIQPLELNDAQLYVHFGSCPHNNKTAPKNTVEEFFLVAPGFRALLLISMCNKWLLISALDHLCSAILTVFHNYRNWPWEMLSKFSNAIFVI